MYGLANEEALVQNIGSVTCLQGRVVCWPNTLQHQVQDFDLVDPVSIASFFFFCLSLFLS